MTETTDNDLIKNYLKGDQESLEVLVARYLQLIYAFVYRYVGCGDQVQDIVQETFVKVWKNLKKFDQDKSFKTWIFAIAKNTAIDYLRKQKTSSFSDFDNEDGANFILDNLVDPAPLSSEIMENNDLADLLSSALNQISPKYRMVLFLYYNDHFNFREIAESLGESINTVKSRHLRALIRLKEILEKSVK